MRHDTNYYPHDWQLLQSRGRHHTINISPPYINTVSRLCSPPALSSYLHNETSGPNGPHSPPAAYWNNLHKYCTNINISQQNQYILNIISEWISWGISNELIFAQNVINRIRVVLLVFVAFWYGWLFRVMFQVTKWEVVDGSCHLCPMMGSILYWQ